MLIDHKLHLYNRINIEKLLQTKTISILCIWIGLALGALFNPMNHFIQIEDFV